MICSSGWWSRRVKTKLVPWGVAGVDLHGDVLEIGPDLRPDWWRGEGVDGGQDNHLFVPPSVTGDDGSGGVRSVGQAHAMRPALFIRRAR